MRGVRVRGSSPPQANQQVPKGWERRAGRDASSQSSGIDRPLQGFRGTIPEPCPLSNYCTIHQSIRSRDGG